MERSFVIDDWTVHELKYSVMCLRLVISRTLLLCGHGFENTRRVPWH